ncbi:hypothetical protein [Azonexus sp.]|uniref:hypothetical protein n=1 Tax=Azonexus sp. TaxID=1872668 RepID=UPI0027B972FB|nr:hypothetical protein [Azonexus sp.]
MAFAVRKLKHRPWPVTVTLQSANADGDIVETEHKFIGHFAPFSEKEYKALVEALKAPVPVAEQPTTNDQVAAELAIADVLERNAKLFSRVLVGWEKVEDESGQPLPYSHDELHAMVTGPDGLAISNGFGRAISEIRFGGAAAKNLNTSVEPGQKSGAAEAATSSPQT